MNNFKLQKTEIVIPRKCFLYAHMTVYKNIGLALKLKGLSNDEIAEMIIEISHIMQIKNILHLKPKALTEFERIKVIVARQLVQKPNRIIFDDNANYDNLLLWKNAYALINKI